MNDLSLVPAKLNVDGLSNADVARVQAFLPYCVGRTRCRWQLAPAGDLGHAVFADVDDPATISGVHRVPGGIVRIHRQGLSRAPSDDPMVLCSPLQLEEFIQMLQRVEARMARTAVMTPAAAPFLPTAAAWSRPPGGDLTPQAAQAPGAAWPVQAPGSLSLTAAYRLKRWPPVSMLSTHRYNARLASFLSARHLTPRQLSTFSNVDSAWCVEFLSALQGIGLLDRQEAVAHPLRASPMPTRHAEPVPAHRSANLLGRIRRRLGIE